MRRGYSRRHSTNQERYIRLILTELSDNLEIKCRNEAITFRVYLFGLLTNCNTSQGAAKERQSRLIRTQMSCWQRDQTASVKHSRFCAR